MVAHHRPDSALLAVTIEEKIRRRLALVWGVTSVAVTEHPDGERMVAEALMRRGGCIWLCPGTACHHGGRSNRDYRVQTNMLQVRIA